MYGDQQMYRFLILFRSGSQLFLDALIDPDRHTRAFLEDFLTGRIQQGGLWPSDSAVITKIELLGEIAPDGELREIRGEPGLHLLAANFSVAAATRPFVYREVWKFV